MDKTTEKENSTDSYFTIKWIQTPKHCKDCTPTPSMLKRRSCAGCTKLMYKK